ncbi:hypothetical protein [Flexivirga meconopsidis]|uniref:hypothetical protein n=1 Tax=Flexivirga meconopsidis TaxID=2977121 RepID=UPI002240DC3B|nr:hypothetical protein [Flexivirga meconopsidis]
MSRLIVTRKTPVFALARGCAILVDGKRVGKVYQNGELVIPVDVGPIKVQAKMDWFSSNLWESTMGSEDVRIILEMNKKLSSILLALNPFKSGQLVLRGV